MTLAVQMQNVALAWRVYDVSQDALALGLVGLASFTPTAALVLVTGLIADRYDRRRILILAYAAMALALGLCLTSETGREASGRSISSSSDSVRRGPSQIRRARRSCEPRSAGGVRQRRRLELDGASDRDHCRAGARGSFMPSIPLRRS